MNGILEVIIELGKDVLIPLLGAFADSGWAIRLLIIVAGLVVSAFIMKIIPNQNLRPLGALAGVVVVGAGFLILSVLPKEKEDTGNLQIAFMEAQIWTEDEKDGEVCTTNLAETLNIDNINLIYTEDGTVCKYNEFSNNILQFNNLRPGSYKLLVKFENYRKKKQVFTLKADDLKDGNWTMQTVNLKSQDSVDDVEIHVTMGNESDKPIKNAKIMLQPEGSEEKLNIPIKGSYKLSKKVGVKDNVSLKAELDYGGKKQAERFTIYSQNSSKTNKNQSKKDTSDTSQSGTQSAAAVDDIGNGLDGSDESDKSSESDKSDEQENNVVVEDQKLYLTFYKPDSSQTGSNQTESDQTEKNTWRMEIDEEENERKEEVQQNNPRRMLEEQKAAVLDREAFGVRDNIDSMLTAENTQEHYTIELESNSYWIEFKPAYLQEYDTGSWHMMITDDADIIRLEFTASANSEKSISDIAELEEGTYNIWIESYDEKGVYDIPYTLILKHCTPVSEETEESEEEQGYLNTFHYGCISQPDDVDCYSFQLEAENVIALKFEHTVLSDDETDWRVLLKNESDDILRNISIIGSEPVTISNNMGLQPGRYTIEVCSGEDYYCSEIYALSMENYTCSYWEKEPNNDFLADDADELTNGVGINANLSDNNDVDNFMFVCPESGSYDLICKHDEIMTDSPGLNIKVCSSSGALVEDYQFYSDWSDVEIVNSIELIEGETYYISIESSDGWQETDYLLRIVSNYEDSTYSNVSFL